MKIQRKSKITELKASNAFLLPAQIEISHSVSVRLSANYNSAECQYGVKLTVNDSPMEVKIGINRAEKMVDDLISKKLRKTSGFLANLAE